MGTDRDLLAALKRDLPQLTKLLGEISDHWCYEDYVYRFYHQSFKVFYMQHSTSAMVDALQALMPEVKLNEWFMQIIQDGTGRHFNHATTNANWLQETRPIVEAFMHAKYMLEMAVQYGNQLDDPTDLLPSGWAAFLYLYGLR
jgi:hypothetical protein